MKYGVQLFSLRKYLKDEQGYEKTFALCKDMGAQVVQLSGGKPVDAKFIASLVKKYDMPICITHDKFERLENDLDALIAEHKTYGCNNLGIGMMPKKFRTGKIEDLQKFVDFLNTTCEKLAKEGMTISYHNHWFEFDQIDGKTIYDYLIENTDERVTFIPDTFWIVFAGKDVCEYLDKLNGRVNTLHLKDYKHKIFRAIGKGTLDFKTILKKAEEIGVQNAVVELDLSPNPIKSMKFSMKTLKGVVSGN